MQLRKSKISAIILSAIAVLSFALTTAVVDILIPILVSRDITTIVENPENLSKPGSILGLIFFLVFILAILTAVGAFWLYRFFGERHYGRGAALLWAIFGISFALLLQAFDLIFQDRLAMLKVTLQFLSVFAAYFLARALIPIDRKP